MIKIQIYLKNLFENLISYIWLDKVAKEIDEIQIR